MADQQQPVPVESQPQGDNIPPPPPPQQQPVAQAPPMVQPVPGMVFMAPQHPTSSKPEFLTIGLPELSAKRMMHTNHIQNYKVSIFNFRFLLFDTYFCMNRYQFHPLQLLILIQDFFIFQISYLLELVFCFSFQGETIYSHIPLFFFE